MSSHRDTTPPPSANAVNPESPGKDSVEAFLKAVSTVSCVDEVKCEHGVVLTNMTNDNKERCENGLSIRPMYKGCTLGCVHWGQPINDVTCHNCGKSGGLESNHELVGWASALPKTHESYKHSKKPLVK